MTWRAAIYARISKKDKKVPKVENQIAMLEALAADNDYEVVARFVDDGIAASGRAIDDTTLEKRQGARDLLAAMRRRDFEVLLVVEGERLARTYLDGLEFIRASVDGGVRWHLDTDGPLDPSTPAGEETAVSIFTSGRREGRVRSSRQKRRYDRERAEGMPLWGPRPFGYEADRITLRAAEADLIREAVTDYLDRKRSMSAIANDWTRAGIVTDGMKRERKGRDGETRPAGTVWTATTVRQLLQRDRNAGILMHDGDRMPKSQITPIITEDQLEALRLRIKTGTPVGARAETLLGGILRCECGAPMHGTTSYSQRKGGDRHVYAIYKCSQTLYDRTRRHASIAQSIVDPLFEGFILIDLFNGHVKPPADDVSADLRSVSTRLASIAEEIEHLGTVLLDRDLRTLHARAKGDLRMLEMERTELKSQRDSLLAQTGENSQLEAFVEELRGETDNWTHTDFQEWSRHFEETWTHGVPNELKRVLIRARYRPIIRTGGRGIARVLANPVDPSTFMQSTAGAASQNELNDE